MSDPINGYVVVMSYSDRSGIRGTFGPYPTEEAATKGIEWLQRMPMDDGIFEVLPLFTSPGSEWVAR
jgi:hypothetical protein